MVTAMEDACPNGVQEEQEEEVTPPRQPGAEGTPAERSTQETDTSGGEERRRRPVTYSDAEIQLSFCIEMTELGIDERVL